MQLSRLTNFLIFLILSSTIESPSKSIAQTLFSLIQSSQFQDSIDPCSYDPQKSQVMLRLLGLSWGYDYDSLLVDLNRRGQSAFVRIDSAGTSVQNCTLWLLMITDRLKQQLLK